MLIERYDRILEQTPTSISAVRNVPATLDVFDHHFPRFPVLPGVLILDSMYALAETLLSAVSGRSWSPASAGRIRYRHYVRPGDQLHLRFELAGPLEAGAVSVVGTAAADVDGRPVTTVRKLELISTAEEST